MKKQIFNIFFFLFTPTLMSFSMEISASQDSVKAEKALLVLEESLSDIGRWIWWTADKDMFHVEFAGAQLFFPPIEKEKIPTSILGLQFSDIKCIARLSRDTLVLNENVEWFDNIQKDLSKPFPLAPGSLTLSNPKKVLEFLNSAQQITFFKGGLEDIQSSNTAETFIGFWAGTAGMIIIANEMELNSHHGKVKLKEIPGLNEKWWNYWKEYWDQKLSGNPKPYDINCEIIVPNRNDNPK